MYNASVSKTKTSQASISKAFLDYQSAAQRDSEMRLYVLVLSVCSFLCLSVCLSPKCVHENAIFSNTEQFRAMVSIDVLYVKS